MKQERASSAQIQYIYEHLELGDRKLAKDLDISLAIARYWIKRAQPKGFKPTKKRTVIRQVSRKMGQGLALYQQAKADHLDQFPNCQICGNTQTQSIHHIAGRSGKLLYEPSNLLTACMAGSYHLSNMYPESNQTEGCHPWIERNLKLAKKLGYSKNKHSTT